MSSLRLECDTERRFDDVRVQGILVERSQGRAPSRVVSETPGTLYSSIDRSPCTSAVTWFARLAQASGTRARTMASSFSKDGYSIH